MMRIHTILARGIQSSDLMLVTLPDTRSRIIQRNASSVYCAVYYRLKGLFRKDRQDTKRFGRQVCDIVAARMKNHGFFTTDERPCYGISYGISEQEYASIFEMTQADESKDLVAMFAYPQIEAYRTKNYLDTILQSHNSHAVRAFRRRVDILDTRLRRVEA